MDPEMLELAHAAVAALQAATQPTWTDITTAFAAVVVGATQCGLIAWGIRVMRDSNQSRDATLTALRDQGQALRDQGQVLADTGEALRDQRQAFRDQDQALRDQDQAFRDQDQALRDQDQAFRDQGQALADIGAGIQELLRERRTT